MAKIDLSLILACYNEGSTFEESVKKIVSVLKKLKKSWEIIFVEDKSQDETKQTVKKLTLQIPNSRVIYHDKNQGRGKSVSDGIKAAKGKICGYLDVDLEVSADYISIFIDEIKKGTDMAIGKRFYEGGFKSLPRFLASKIYSLAVNLLLGISISDTEAGYKFFKRARILPLLSKIKSRGWFWDTEICARAYLGRLKIGEVPVLFVRHPDKKSTVRLIPDSIDYVKNLVKFRSKLNQVSKA